MTKLTEIIVRRPVAALIIISAIIIFGGMAILQMPQEITPEMEMPMLIVSTVYPGAGPDDVDELISSLFQETISEHSGIRNITTQSMENISLILLQYEYGFDMDRAYTNVTRSINSLANRLPENAMTPIIFELNFNTFPTMTLSINSETRENLLYFIEDEIVPQLNRLASVSSADVTGGREDYVRVEIIEERLQEHRLSIQNVIQAVGGINHTAPLGHAEFGDIDLAVRVQVKHETIEALNRIPITTPMGDVIRLADVSNIYISTKEADSISRLNGNENIGINIQKPQAVSANRTSRDVQRVLDRIARDNPDISIITVNDNSEAIADSINSVAQTLILAIVLSMIVLFLFLGDLRASLIVGSSMPVSLLVTFIFMSFMGYSLNIITMGGLVIGVGMMVDNAIVVIDSCTKSRKSGKRDFIEGAIHGTSFVMLSVIAGTLTTVVTFVPLAVMDGMSGQLFGPLGFSIVFALLASLLSAITLVPLFYAQFKPIEKEKTPIAKIMRKLENFYARILKFILRRKKTVFIFTLGIVVVAVCLLQFINFELMPAMDEGIIRMSVETRPGLNIENEDAILSKLEEIAAAHPDVERFTLTSGGGGIFGSGGTSLTAYLHSDREMETNEIVEQWRFETANIPDIDIDVAASGSMDMMGGVGNINVVLLAEDLDEIIEGSLLVEEVMYNNPNIIRVNSSIARTNPQAEIAVDHLMAAANNISPQMVTGTIYTAINGSDVTEITIDNQRYNIWVKYPAGRYESVSDLNNMTLMSATGEQVPLTAIASIEFSDIPQTIVRQNGFYTVTITGVSTEAERFIAREEINAAVDKLEFPSTVRVGQSTEAEMEAEELASLATAILTSVLLVFMVMAIQFESIRHSLMVMVCVPLAVVGSLFLMFLTSVTISMVSLLGFLILVGLVVNNGILFVDTTNRYREEMPLHEALIDAGRTRLRPILMTSLTTIFSMLPLALGIGDGNEMMQGLGITVIGGITASTILALLVLPTFYLIIDGNRDKRIQRKKERIEKRDKKVAVMEEAQN